MPKFKYCLSCRYKNRILEHCKKFGKYHKLYFTKNDYIIIKFCDDDDYKYIEINVNDMVDFMKFVMLRNYHCGGVYDYYRKTDMKDIPLANTKKENNLSSNLSDFDLDEDDENLTCEHNCKHRQYTMEYVRYMFKHNMIDHIKLFLKKSKTYDDYEGLFYSLSLLEEEDVKGYDEYSCEIISSSLELSNYKTSKYVICNVYAEPYRILDYLSGDLKLSEIRKYLRICTSKKYFESVSNAQCEDQFLNLTRTLWSILYYDDVNIFKFIVEEFYKVKNRVDEKYQKDYIFDLKIIPQILKLNGDKSNIVKFLTEGRVNIQARVNEALINFCRQDFKMVKFLIKFGANIRVRNDESLNQASKYGQIDIVQYLVNKGANINADNDKALISACSRNHLDVVKYLVKNGANIYADNKKALIIVTKRLKAGNGSNEIINFFKENGVDFNLINDFFCENWRSA
ncbi:repeat protein [Moumouvirus goulette]|uniref:Repeat protein n=1 Tax=Moumouvirus goulette TaxID=1247379 RepID=M1NLI8_9VIRU|nr:repeat protein [Moumouvirus goulette]AGF84870.1 repeat protein [Moumouvirus goulette]